MASIETTLSCIHSHLLSFDLKVRNRENRSRDQRSLFNMTVGAPPPDQNDGGLFSAMGRSARACHEGLHAEMLISEPHVDLPGSTTQGISQSLSCEDFKTMRLVCHGWMQVSQSVSQSQAMESNGGWHNNYPHRRQGAKNRRLRLSISCVQHEHYWLHGAGALSSRPSDALKPKGASPSHASDGAQSSYSPGGHLLGKSWLAWLMTQGGVSVNRVRIQVWGRRIQVLKTEEWLRY